MSAQKIGNEKLDFLSFIKTYFLNYVVDEHNHSLLNKLTFWAARDEKFESKLEGYHLDKGILLMGPVGSGKTDLFHILQVYIDQYLRSNYRFSYHVVWQFTSEFNIDGYEALKGEGKGNRYYDELCLSDSRSKMPMKEYAMHYGSKLLIGEEIIMLRYNSFKREGWQTHFSTNASPTELQEVYGERAFSRIKEMCNIMVLGGADRRNSGKPNIYRNTNNPKPPKPKEIDIDSELENKKIIDDIYIKYINNEPININLSLLYNTMVAYGISVATDDEMRVIIESISIKYAPETVIFRGSKSEMEKQKRDDIWERSRKIAVITFFQRMKDGKAKTIFGVVDATKEVFKAETIFNNANK